LLLGAFSSLSLNITEFSITESLAVKTVCYILQTFHEVGKTMNIHIPFMLLTSVHLKSKCIQLLSSYHMTLKTILKKCNTAVLFQLMIQLQDKEGISLTAVHQYILQLQTSIIIRMLCISEWLGDVNVSHMNETLTNLCFQVTITEM